MLAAFRDPIMIVTFLYVQSHKNVAKVWLPEPFKDAEGMMLEGLACIGVVCQDPGDGCIRTTFRVVPG